MNGKESIKQLKQWLSVIDLKRKANIIPNTDDIQAIETILNLIEKQKAEIEKKDLEIDLMAEQLANYKHEEIICMEVDCKHIELQNEGKCIGDKECIKQYFEKKAEEDK